MTVLSRFCAISGPARFHHKCDMKGCKWKDSFGKKSPAVIAQASLKNFRTNLLLFINRVPAKIDSDSETQPAFTGGREEMFSVVARFTSLDINREYCTKYWDTYPKSSEPELLSNYTKVPFSHLLRHLLHGAAAATLCAEHAGGRALSVCPLTLLCASTVLVRSLPHGRPRL